MLKILYSNIHEVPDKEIGSYLQRLPAAMRSDVTRYVCLDDQKSSLVARLLLYHSLSEEGKLHLLAGWQRDLANKPFIEGWHPFNISHAGDLVIFSCGDTISGIDIEKVVPLNYKELSTYFHPQEQDYILGSADIQQSFFEIWVKKEALLKAIGTGIVNGLTHFNCVHNQVMHEGACWYLHPLNIHPDYTGYLCCLEKKFCTPPQFIHPEAIHEVPTC